MRSRKSRLIALVGALVTLPVAVAVGQQLRAIRQSGASCFLQSGFGNTMLVDLYTPGGIHDWGIGNTKGTDTVAYCPVTLDVPRTESNPVDKVHIIYSTREDPVVGGAVPSGVSPVIQSCTAFLMDGSGTGTWVGQTTASPAGINTGNVYVDRTITIDSATVPLGAASLRRMLITCTLPRGVTLGGYPTYTALIKGYEVEYKVTPPDAGP